MIERAIVVSLLIVATSISFEPEMLLHKFAKVLSKLFPEGHILNKPTHACVGCMASIWGAIYYSATSLLPYFDFSLIEMIFVCIVCIPLNFIFTKLA
jgi:hypothetical protein